MSQIHEVSVIDDSGPRPNVPMRALIDLDDISLLVPYRDTDKTRAKFKGCEVWVVIDMTMDEVKALFFSRKINGIMMS